MTDGLGLVTCEGCGLVYVNPRLNEPARRQHFAERYIPSVEVLQRSFEGRRALALDRIAAMVAASLPAGGRILDVGCAGGAFLRRFNGAKWQRFGVEPSLVASEQARRLTGAQIFTGELGQTSFAAGSFDAVVLLDTLIVVPDPRGVLEECQRILRKGGMLFIELPGFNFRMLKSSLTGARGAALNPKELLYHFPDGSIRKLLRGCGFEAISMFASAPSLYGGAPRRLLLRMLDAATLAAYRLSFGHLNLLPKYVYAARKPASP
jgi:SAM-dependent methyltransferase